MDIISPVGASAASDVLNMCCGMENFFFFLDQVFGQNFVHMLEGCELTAQNMRR